MTEPKRQAESGHAKSPRKRLSSSGPHRTDHSHATNRTASSHPTSDTTRRNKSNPVCATSRPTTCRTSATSQPITSQDGATSQLSTSQCDTPNQSPSVRSDRPCAASELSKGRAARSAADHTTSAASSAAKSWLNKLASEKMRQVPSVPQVSPLNVLLRNKGKELEPGNVIGAQASRLATCSVTIRDEDSPEDENLERVRKHYEDRW